MKKEEVPQNISAFPIGEENVGFKQYFTGESWLARLTNNKDLNVPMSNVTFEPGCRNNWHIHHDGYQILLVTGGEGWYQEDGKPAQSLKPGDVIVTHDGVKHWHGAAKDSWFEHIAITAVIPEWLEAVSEELYQGLHK